MAVADAVIVIVVIADAVGCMNSLAAAAASSVVRVGRSGFARLLGSFLLLAALGSTVLEPDL